uniref:Proliferation-associated protein 2G4 n=1 Tax=Schistosoma haematobium TaxID=6185 RepID=A0A095A6S8_SCHHA
MSMSDQDSDTEQDVLDDTVVNKYKMSAEVTNGMQCHQMKKLVYDAEKNIVFSPTEEQKKTVEKCTFDINDVWNVDIIVSTGDGRPREHRARTTLFKKNETLYQLKMKAARHEFVAQFRFTVLLMPNGPMKVTGLTFDPSLYKSEHKVKDPEIKELLSQPIKIQNKKKKPLKPESVAKISA